MAHGLLYHGPTNEVVPGATNAPQLNLAAADIRQPNFILLTPLEEETPMMQKLRGNKEGFTLIELMIVIAIIGILAAIAIPNFIAYRNKAFCSAAESDANTVAAAIADYFSNPMKTAVPTLDDLGVTLSGTNSLGSLGDDPNDITITITDGSSRCPSDYKTGNSRWSGNDYTINMQ